MLAFVIRTPKGYSENIIQQGSIILSHSGSAAMGGESQRYKVRLRNFSPKNKKKQKSFAVQLAIVLLPMSATRLHHTLQKLKKFEADRSERAEVK